MVPNTVAEKKNFPLDLETAGTAVMIVLEAARTRPFCLVPSPPLKPPQDRS
jgi:hypothetical protein